MAYMATVDPVQAPLAVRPAERVPHPEVLTGSPCLVGGAVVGLLTGKTAAGRPHMLCVLPMGAVMDRCAPLGERAGVAITHAASRCRLPPPPWPRWRPGMVGWYNPGPLVATAVNMVISKTFGTFDDRRSVEGSAAAHYEHALAPVSEASTELWVDYVADTGDGFDSTYAVASAVSLPHLPLRHPTGEWEATKRGHVLVFGGDQVYPMATALDYYRRFITPFRLAAAGDQPRPSDALETVHPWSRLPSDAPPDALPGYDPRAPWSPDREFVGADDGVAPVDRMPPRLPWVVALPGNHDWYDNLVQFMKIFASGERFAEWNPVQSRSYFVKKLPFRWWIFGVDIQLTGDIDQDQLRYMLDWVDALRPGDQVILCIPEPTWLDTGGPEHRRYLSVLERALEEGGHLRLWLAGDLHHYRRHEGVDGRQKIVAGGGGAFLHATHPTKPIEVLPRRGRKAAPAPLQPGEYGLKASFPSPRASRILALRNLLFPFLNWRFGGFLGALYVVAAWLLAPEPGNTNFEPNRLHTLGIGQVGEVVRMMGEVALINPVAGLFLLAIVGGIRMLSNTPSPLYNNIAGLVHGLTHVLAIFATVWFVSWLTVAVMGLTPRQPVQLLLGAPMVGLLGALVGGGLMGLYLWISSTFFGLHQNEAFSSIRNPDWKCFLRLKITAESLTIYPVGFRRVPHTWKPRKGRSGPLRWPWPVIPTRPFLIEAPIVLKAPPPE
ncbi:MAG: hypothetical protein R3F43_20885 [bacterium]